ncbi:MAG: type II toxin-antitoxin system Phd/YefM family antitoxin [Candidatus Binatia bacterium]
MMMSMRSAGLREVRQKLPALLKEVRKGREVVITDRGRPVARLVPTEPVKLSARPFPSHQWLRDKIQVKGRPLSEDLEDERADRV